MSFIEKTEMELIQLAITSDDLKLLEVLFKSEKMNVRRALARNKNIDATLANKLLFDPVLNVSYIASFNPNTTQKREFDEDMITPCVKCSIDERKLDCLNCIYFKNL
ncbi:hypothetical protein CRV08_06420 [Halarcobacter ebronensis]|uniref:Uncharacterized protein n=1 Tax=Halarcobacter ebronensis TaxID=1462615 RepID=A0A4Q0YDE7_9BACT|nr:hypothetical protein [Halarcobacter ebronensis]RXJ68462.1 hypothetical protein CRV08_06420 [Halarcobacter ebronensis]